MSLANALQGTRMGRKVKTVDEFMAEMNGMGECGPSTVLEERLPSAPDSGQAIVSNLFVRPRIDGWEISNLRLRGARYDYNLARGVLGLGHDHDYWKQYAELAFSENRYIPAASDVLFAIMDQLRAAANCGPADETRMAASEAAQSIAMVFNRASKSNETIGLFSKALYNHGTDAVIHDPFIGKISYPMDGCLWGPQADLLKLIDAGEYCRLIFGCLDANRVAQVIGAYNGGRTIQVGRFPFSVRDARNQFIAFSSDSAGFHLDSPPLAAKEFLMFGVKQVKKYDVEVPTP